MISCVLNVPLPEYEYIFASDDGNIDAPYPLLYLYTIPIKEYKKQLIKDNVILDEDTITLVVTHYINSRPPYIDNIVFKCLERLVLLRSDLCLYYADTILKGRFVKGEHKMGSDAHIGYMYSRDVLKGTFKQYEDNIIKQYQTSKESFSSSDAWCIESYISEFM